MMFSDYQFKHYNYRLILYVLALNGLGVLVIGSATQDTAQVSKQIMGIGIGLIIAVALSLLDYHRITSMAVLVYLGCVAGLLAVLFFGENVNNATRWLKLPGIGQVQPSEFVKIGLIVFLSWFFSKNQEKVNYITTLLLASALLLVVFGLIYEEPDLSTGLVIIFVFTCMLFAAGLSYRWILSGLAVLVPGGTLFIYLLLQDKVPFLKGYQARRILAFIDREKYAEANLQQDNSIMAIGSGMLHGKGLNYTANSVKNGNFLSEEQTDFIFAVIGEELGFIGCTAVIILIAIVVYECLIMAGRAKDMAGRLICVGMAALLAFQSFSNIAVATGVFPNTGLPLPFISYGVSSLMSMYIGIGLTLNVGLQRKNSNY